MNGWGIRVARRLALGVGLLPGLVAGPLGAAEGGVIRIEGSDTMLLLARRWAEDFMVAHPGVVVEVEGGGTRLGVEALIRGDVDLATGSRPLTPRESSRLAECCGSLGFAVLTARDALTVYLNDDNPVTGLSMEQLRSIFTGEVRRWSDVGGRDAAIRVLDRNPASGTHLFFAEHVLGGDDYTRRARVLSTTGAIVDAVRRDRDAIGYGGHGYVRGVRACPIDGVEPTAESVRDGTYPIARYLYLYTVQRPAGLVKELVDWVLGARGQAAVAELGYVPLYEAPVEEEGPK